MPRDAWAGAKRKDMGRRAAAEAEREAAYRRAAALKRRLERKAERQANPTRASGPGPVPAGYRPAKPDTIAEAFAVPASAPCFVRRDGEKAWKPHTTSDESVFDGFAWRNEKWYGFKRDAWELKVPIAFVRAVSPR